jgi:uncharacterized membrane protein YfcA
MPSRRPCGPTRRSPNVTGIALSTADAGLLLGAGVLAGVVGTAGGITSLISYPALLAVGLPVLPANVTNIVSVVACWPGSALASQHELRGKGAWLRRFALVAGAGGAVGAGLLLSTPAGVFGDVVPYLLAFASLGLLAQPRLSDWLGTHAVRGFRWALPCGLFCMSVYNGYFGAGSGVMILALLMLTVDPHIARANALKNMLVGAAAFVSAALFACFGHVDWAAAGPLALGLLVGATLGPALARRVPAGLLRWLVALTGLGLAVRLWVAPL